MLTHADFHYSITVHTEDFAALHCLRGLSMFAQQSGNKRIPWGGTKEKDWLRKHHHATFHFSSKEFRQQFEYEANRLLHAGTWSKQGELDDDPAEPQSDNDNW